MTSNSRKHRNSAEPTSQSKLGLAMVGCGYWGRNLARNLDALGVLKAVCDADRAAAASISETYGVRASSWAEVLGDAEINAVVLATPAETHGAMAVAAMQAGKDVFVEKPIALDLREAEKLVAIAQELDRVLMVGHLLQYHPGFLALKELVRAGEIGRLQYVYSTRVNLGKIRREEDILWSFAPHDISMILALVDETPSEVRAVGSSFLHEQIADSTITHLVFGSGVAAHVFVSWLHPFKEQRLVVVGDRGMLVFDDTRPWSEKLARYNHEIRWIDGIPNPVKADPDFVQLPEEEPLKNECRHFIDCIENRQTPRTDGREGLRVLTVLKQATMALVSNAPQKSESGVPGYKDSVFVHESAYVDEEVEIGEGTKVWHFCHILNGSKLGENCVLGQNVMIGPDVSIGDGCKIQNNVSVYKGVTLQDAVFCGPSCVFTNVYNPRADVERKDEFRETVVGRGATIGANATIICGNNIGAYSFVAAGAVVTKDVPDFAIVAGVPARRTGWVSHAGEILGKDLICPKSGRKYRPVGNDRIEESTA